MRSALVVLLAGCGRVGFDPVTSDAAGADTIADAFDESRCTWSVPTEIPGINTDEIEAEPAMSPDGSLIVFASNRFGDGIDRLYGAPLVGTDWTPARIVELDSSAGDMGP